MINWLFYTLAIIFIITPKKLHLFKITLTLG